MTYFQQYDKKCKEHCKILLAQIIKICKIIINIQKIDVHTLDSMKNASNEYIKCQYILSMVKFNKNANRNGILICNFCNKRSEHKKHKKCAKCYETYYCSIKCQKNNWKQHKLKCIKFIKPVKTKICNLIEVFEKFRLNSVKCCLKCGKNLNNNRYIICNLCNVAHYCTHFCMVKNKKIHNIKCSEFIKTVNDTNVVIKNHVNDLLKRTN
jgi:hypothetical protein